RIAAVRHQAAGDRDLVRRAIAARQPERYLRIVADDAVVEQRGVRIVQIRAVARGDLAAAERAAVQPAGVLAGRQARRHLPPLRQPLAGGELDAVVGRVEIWIVVDDVGLQA